jgi:hypothetical protein
MSALAAPSEVLLVALFGGGTVRVEAAVESLWRRGLEAERLSLLALEPAGRKPPKSASLPDWRRQRAVTPHLWFRFPVSAIVHLPQLGSAVALGPLAEELTRGPAIRRGRPRLDTALRRLGLPPEETPRLCRELGSGRILLVACVARSEVQDWGAQLQLAGAESLTAHPRLDPWPVYVRPRRRHREARRSPDHGNHDAAS